MSFPIPRDHVFLAEASSALNEAATRSGIQPTADLRIRLLEGAAARVGGFNLSMYDQVVKQSGTFVTLPPETTIGFTDKLAQALKDGPINPSLSLAALGDYQMDPLVRRRRGCYFTDTRLALDLANNVKEKVIVAKSILDPACGAGVLLVATAIQEGTDQNLLRRMVGSVLWGVDCDQNAVRVAKAAISSLTCDLRAVKGLCRRLFVADSLIEGQKWWRSKSNVGFDLVLGNPPWEKLKTTKHEYVLRSGVHRYYGDDYSGLDVSEQSLQSDKVSTIGYRDSAEMELVHQGSGEADLYKMFIELSANLVSDAGSIALIVPAGFIRNKGALELRNWLFHYFDTDILILDNRRHYFSIDSRFKFLQLFATRIGKGNRKIRFGSACFGEGADKWKAETSLLELKKIQPDLELPEVRGNADWKLFVKMRRSHPEFGSNESQWCPQFHREIDMTGDKAKFKSTTNGTDILPVIEGRMVHQHRVSAKRYVSGRGRRAKWMVQPPFGAPMIPQWFVQQCDIHPNEKKRVTQLRAGFCDITGQTNERTVLAALIPNGVVCGNKVPTIDFASEEKASAWVGIANSFTFDWLARRLVTTTLNFSYFGICPFQLGTLRTNHSLASLNQHRLCKEYRMNPIILTFGNWVKFEQK